MGHSLEYVPCGSGKARALAQGCAARENPPTLASLARQGVIDKLYWSLVNLMGIDFAPAGWVVSPMSFRRRGVTYPAGQVS